MTGTDVDAFLYNNGAITPIDIPGGTSATVNGMRRTGQIVGSRLDTTLGMDRGFLYSNGVLTMINVPGKLSTDALGINNFGRSLEGSLIVKARTVSCTQTVFSQSQFAPNLSFLAVLNDEREIVSTVFGSETNSVFVENGGAFSLVASSPTPHSHGTGLTGMIPGLAF